MAILWLLVVALVGAAGFFAGRHFSTGRKHAEQLQANLAEKDEEIKAYRQQVNQHFSETAQLFGDLTNHYRHLYDHLAQGANRLCEGDTARLRLESAMPVATPGLPPQQEAVPTEQTPDVEITPKPLDAGPVAPSPDIDTPAHPGAPDPDAFEQVKPAVKLASVGGSAVGDAVDSDEGAGEDSGEKSAPAAPKDYAE